MYWGSEKGGSGSGSSETPETRGKRREERLERGEMRDWRQERGERRLWRAVQSGERRGGERCSSGAYGEWRGEERRERT